MGLLTRLTIPLEGEEKIATHQFMALVAEYQRGVVNVDRDFIATTFDIVEASELVELDSILTEIVSKRTNRELLHDVLLIGEDGAYDTTKVSNRIAQPNGDTDLESITQRQTYRISNAAQTGEFAFRGCNVNQQTVPDLTVEVTEGSILSNGRNVNDVAAVAAFAIPTPDPDLPRVDLIYVDNNGAVQVRTGDPSLDPKAPVISMVNECALAFVFVGAAATEIQAKHIQDVTIRRNHGPLRIGTRTNKLVVTNTTDVTQLFGQNIPGQMLNGRVVRLVASGTITAAVQNNVEFRIRYGGTVLWRDSTKNLNASFDARPWRIELELMGTADGTQVLSGQVQVMDPAQPNVGSGAINNDETDAYASIRGEGLVDSTVTESFNIASAMSVADAANSITIDQAYAELL
tara:strand:- start:4495 stop:5706 length:1212 start_codon:yes stop_codon:yes gene_type:complete